MKLVREIDHAILSLFIILVISIMLNMKKIKFKYFDNFVCILIIGIGVRLVYYYFMGTEQTSDFNGPTKFYFHLQQYGPYINYIVNKNQLDNFQIYYSLFPTWGNYMRVIITLYGIFGYSKELVIYINIVLYSLTLILLHFSLKRAFNKKISLMVITIFSLYPQLIMWNSIAAPDHFIFLLISILIYLWIKYFEIRKNNRKLATELIIIMSFIMSFINLFKPLSILFLLIYISTEILCYIQNYKDNYKKNSFYHLVFIIMFFIFTIVNNSVSQKSLANIIKTDIQQGNAFYILWGYSVDKDKNWSDSIGSEIIKENLENVSTLKEGLENLEIVAKKTIKENICLLPKIWCQKAIQLFASENWAVYWTNTSNDIRKREWIQLHLENFMKSFITIFNSLIMLLMPFALWKRKKIINMLSVSWIGYMIFLIVASVQTRYRCIMYIQQCILGVLGFNVIITKFKFFKRRKRLK